jgi:Legume lectin domain/PEP-CTERM motif
MNTAPGCMSNGNFWTATITYDGSNLSATLKDSAEASTFSAISSFPIDIKSFLGTSNAFVGFTSGTGAGFENHDILNWTFSNSATLPGTVPEPGTWVLLGSGLLFAPFCSRLRKRRP